MSPNAFRAELNVLVADDHLSRVEEVVERLRAVGMHVTDVQETLGSIVGDIDEAHVQEVRSVRGVSAVEPTRRFQLPTPGEDVQ